MGNRIDLDASREDTGELLVRQGFCRTVHLLDFCADTGDDELELFAAELLAGVRIRSRDEAKDFAARVDDVVERLEAAPVDSDDFRQFLDDLRQGVDALRQVTGRGVYILIA